MFLDETAAATNMARRYGWAPRGERCRLAAPSGHYKTTTVTAALRTTGLCATALFDGPTNGTRFRSYITEIRACRKRWRGPQDRPDRPRFQTSLTA